MASRVTWFYRQADAGWTLNLYNLSDDYASVLARASFLTSYLVQLIPPSCIIKRVRVSRVGIFRDVFLANEQLDYQGKAASHYFAQSAYSSTSILVQLVGQARARGHMFMRPAPLNSGQDGGQDAFSAFVGPFNGGLKPQIEAVAAQWALRTIDPANPQTLLNSLQYADGVFNLTNVASDNQLLVGNRIHIYYVKVGGLTLRNDFRVTAATATTVQCVPINATFLNGLPVVFNPPFAFFQKKSYAYTQIQSAFVERVVTRRVGRFFGTPVGRHSRVPR